MKSQPTLHGTIGQNTAHSVGKLLLGAISLLFVLSLVSLLPGIDRLLPGTPISLFALAGAIAAIVVAGVLLYTASGLAALTRMLLSGPPEVVEHVASIVHWLAVLAAVLVAHRGLQAMVRALFDGAAWAYDVVFLLLALPPLVIIAARLYVSLDPAAALMADALAGVSDA